MSYKVHRRSRKKIIEDLIRYYYLPVSVSDVTPEHSAMIMRDYKRFEKHMKSICEHCGRSLRGLVELDCYEHYFVYVPCYYGCSNKCKVCFASVCDTCDSCYVCSTQSPDDS